jgi:hypothetical protein
VGSWLLRAFIGLLFVYGFRRKNIKGVDPLLSFVPFMKEKKKKIVCEFQLVDKYL